MLRAQEEEDVETMSELPKTLSPIQPHDSFEPVS